MITVEPVESIVSRCGSAEERRAVLNPDRRNFRKAVVSSRKPLSGEEHARSGYRGHALATPQEPGNSALIAAAAAITAALIASHLSAAAPARNGALTAATVWPECETTGAAKA